MSPIGARKSGRVGSAVLAARSAAALDRPLAHDAELLVAEPADDAIVLGALQRASEIADRVDPSFALLRRGSGGAEARIGPGTLWMQLALARPDVLVACEPGRLLNRHVRPLLRALARVGALAHYFDRDWISVAKRPVGLVSFAHDTTTGRALVEAILAVDAPFAVRPRASYLGKSTATIAETGARCEVDRLATAILEAYGAAYGRAIVLLDEPLPDLAAAPQATGDPREDPPWIATRDEAIGVVAAGRDARGLLRIGGELMASRDAVARLEAALGSMPDTANAAAIGAVLDRSLGAPGVALLGVRSLTSLRDAILEARAQ